MVPKIIHFIWFGNKPFPPKIKKCIDSWKKYLSDYQIIQWDESNFDINNACQFVREAYECGQYAFVSDYVRFYVLKQYGGIYLDTDVEVIKPFKSEFLETDVALALDDGGYISGSTIFSVPDSEFIKDCLSHYHSISFIRPDGSYENEVINTNMQEILHASRYRIENVYQKVDYKGEKCIFYPNEFFHVRSLSDGKMELTGNSYAIHWHTILWASTKTKIINFLRINVLTRVLGTKLYSRIARSIKNGKTTF